MDSNRTWNSIQLQSPAVIPRNTTFTSQHTHLPLFFIVFICHTPPSSGPKNYGPPSSNANLLLRHSHNHQNHSSYNHNRYYYLPYHRYHHLLYQLHYPHVPPRSPTVITLPLAQILAHHQLSGTTSCRDFIKHFCLQPQIYFYSLSIIPSFYRITLSIATYHNYKQLSQKSPTLFSRHHSIFNDKLYFSNKPHLHFFSYLPYHPHLPTALKF